MPLVSMVERPPNFGEYQGVGKDEVPAFPGLVELLFEVKKRAILVLIAKLLIEKVNTAPQEGSLCLVHVT